MSEEEKKAIDKLKSWKSYMEKDEDEMEVIDTISNLIEKLQKENEELKNKVVKRDKELIRLEEYANKNFERKDDVKANYIPKDKIKKKIEELNNYYKKEVYPIKYQWADVDITEFYDSQIDLLEDLLKGE